MHPPQPAHVRPELGLWASRSEGPTHTGSVLEKKASYQVSPPQEPISQGPISPKTPPQESCLSLPLPGEGTAQLSASKWGS